MLRRLPLALNVAVIAALVLVSTSALGKVKAPTRARKARVTTTRATTANPRPPSNLVWTDCDDTEFECSTLVVPMDYSHPDGPQITLAIHRRRAVGPKPRIGVELLLSGPPYAASQSISTEGTNSELDRFDQITIDHRGSGESSPIRCATSTDELGLGLFADLRVPEVEQRALSAWRVDCLRRAGPLVQFVRVSDAAMDIERVRQALNEKQLSIDSSRYGAAIASVYATLFPTQVRSLVLREPMDPSRLSRFLTDVSTRINSSLDDFLRECSASKCALDGPGGAKIRLDALADLLLKNPLPAEPEKGRGIFTPGALTAFTFARVVEPAQWPALARDLDALDHGDRTPIENSRRIAVLWVHPITINGGPFWAVACRNGLYPSTRPTVDAAVKEAGTHWFKLGLHAGLDECLQWGVTGEAPPPVANALAVKPLILSQTDDRTWPTMWADNLADTMRPAVLYRFNAIARPGCVHDAVVAYLVDLIEPDPIACGTP